MDMQMDSDEEEEWSKPVEEAKDTYKPNNKQKTGSHSRVILHIDIDCFYAQVEMLRNPELRNKPLGVQQKYIIVTCNYVARERGLTKLMRVKDAKERCPDLVLVNGEDLTNYRNMSYKISNYLQKYCPLVERLGFDENFLDITDLVNDRINSRKDPCLTEVKGHVYKEENHTNGACSCGCRARLIVGSHIAAEIRAGLLKELGITCCGGIAHNKLLSKLVAGTHKPNQQTTLFSDDVKTLMSSLASVRSIQGIGHTTARRLNDLGVVTVVDLQNVEVSVLEEEFGHMSAETMKKLCVGIDDCPVLAFGLPQTLSDEDSFKKCSDLEDAKARIKQLINSLLNRLLEDGRRPQTLRLTIRRMSETNRYNNRESRQCNIPPAVFNKFSVDNLASTQNQLEVLAYSLFTKMVDTKSSFHLTLINVAFARLEQKSANDISSFFSPRGPPQHTSVETLYNTEENSSLSNKGHENTIEKFKNSAENNETMSDNDKLIFSRQVKVKSPSMNMKSVSGIQKWFVKQPEEHGNTSKDKMTPVRNLDSDFTMEDRQHGKGSYTRKTSKRHSSDSNIDKDEENFMKKARTDTDSDKSALPSNVAELLPADIDISVFLELPPDIQKDVLENSASCRDLSAESNRTVQKTDLNMNTFLKASVPLRKSIVSKTQSEPVCIVAVSNTYITACAEKANDTFSDVDTEHADKYTELEISDLQVDKGALDCRQSTGSKNMDQICTDTDHFQALTPVRSSVILDRCVTDQSKQSIPEEFTVPADIDSAVFESLPPEIKQELVQQWKSEKDGKTKNAGRSNRQEKNFFKSPKPSTSSNITDYFQKKT